MLIEKVKNLLVNTYSCHTIILYGSYVKGDFTNDSDLDVIGFAEIKEPLNETQTIDGVPLDAWIYPTEMMGVSEDYLRLFESKILLDERERAGTFIAGIQALFEAGTAPVSDNQREFLKAWLSKMFKRSIREDAEGYYRRHWLIVESLSIYFELTNRWFLGPKKALKWLELNEIEVYKLYLKSLNGSGGDLKRWIDFLINEV